MIFREVEDRDLILKARGGNVDAYNLLVSRWEKRIYNYLLRITGNREDAMDLSQDAFLKAYQNLRKLDDAARFGPWLYRIAHNEAYSLLRKPKADASKGYDEVSESSVSSNWGRRMLPMEASLAVERALDRLSPDQREAVLLKVYQGFKFEEIAEITATPVSTIKSRVYTALELLKESLAPVRSEL